MGTGKPDLQARIAKVLDGEHSSVVIDALLEETRNASRETADKLQLAHSRAMDPRADSIASLAAHQEASRLDFERNRLAAAEQALQDALGAAQKREAEARYAERRTQIIAERDALASELADRYPALAAELAELLRRMELSDAATAGMGLEPVETLARGLPANMRDTSGAYPSLREVSLPSFHCRNRQRSFIWHPNVQPGARAAE